MIIHNCASRERSAECPHIFKYSICKLAVLYEQHLPHLITVSTRYAQLFFVADNHMSQTEHAQEHGLKLDSRGVHNL